MDTPAPTPVATQPVAVAALTRTSTLDLQNPVASARRQLRAISDWLPAGWYLAAVYSDVESGATDLDGRSQGEAWRILTDAGLPRDGGMANLLEEAASPTPAFSVVVVEDIERASRDFYDSVKLERRLGQQGIPLLATDEPADITGLNATTVLVRRVKQGVAEWYRIQLKAKTRKGLEQHAIDGYNNGRVPYGYVADRIAHPVPVKAGQGRIRTRLAADPQAAPWVTRIFEWRVLENLSREAIAGRLEAAGVPSPGSGGGWGPMTVGKILANPKYTGYMVYGRTKNTGKSQRPGQRKIRAVPREQWTWSPQPVHPALVSRQLWEEAQKVGKAHEGVRDPEVPTSRDGRRYPLRSRLHCSQCGRRMTGSTRPGRREGQCYTYYVCPWREINPRDVHRCEHHVRTAVREDAITAAIAEFLDQFVFGHDRAAMLQAHLPASAAEAAARREAQARQLRKRVARNEASQKGLIAELAQLGDDASPAATEYRKRIREHHTELYSQGAALHAQLEAITAQAASENDPALIEQLPYAPGFLLRAPDHVREALYAALNLHCTFRGDKQQVTIRATITDTTPGIVAALIADPRTDAGSPKRSPGPLDDPNNSAITTETGNKARAQPMGAGTFTPRPTAISVSSRQTLGPNGMPDAARSASLRRPSSPGTSTSRSRRRAAGNRQ